MAFSITYNFVSIDKFSDVAQKVGRSVDKVNKKVGKLGNKFAASAISAGRFGKKLLNLRTLLAGAGLFFGIRKLITEGTRFQDSMADLQAITGAVGDDLENLRRSALKNSVAFARSGAKIADAFTLVGSKKPELLKNTDALIDMTEKVLLLQAASGVNLSEAAEVTSVSLNTFGKEASEAGKFVDILAAGAKFGSSMIEQTGRAALIAGPQFASLNISFLDLNAVLQATARSGFVAQKAGVALQAIFSRLSEAGLDFEKVGVVENLELVKAAFDKLKTQTERTTLATQLFGREHAKVALPLLQNIGLIKQFQRQLRKTGVAQEQANIRLATFNTRLRRLGARIQNKLIDLFDKLEPKFIEITEQFGKFLDSIGPAEVDAAVQALEVLADALKVILFTMQGIAKVGGFIGKIVSGAHRGVTGAKPEFIGPTRPSGSESTVNVNINAAEGVVGSVTTKSVGKTNFNLGQNGTGGLVPAGT